LDLERRGCSRSVLVDAREVASGLALYESPASLDMGRSRSLAFTVERASAGLDPIR
jgi:hypothetical protein